MSVTHDFTLKARSVKSLSLAATVFLQQLPFKFACVTVATRSVTVGVTVSDQVTVAALSATDSDQAKARIS